MTCAAYWHSTRWWWSETGKPIWDVKTSSTYMGEHTYSNRCHRGGGGWKGSVDPNLVWLALTHPFPELDDEFTEKQPSDANNNLAEGKNPVSVSRENTDIFLPCLYNLISNGGEKTIYHRKCKRSVFSAVFTKS